MFVRSHQDPGSAALHLLKLFNTLARDPDEKCIAVVQSGGDRRGPAFLHQEGLGWDGVWRCSLD